jgi:hypothetical protein
LTDELSIAMGREDAKLKGWSTMTAQRLAISRTKASRPEKTNISANPKRVAVR